MIKFALLGLLVGFLGACQPTQKHPTTATSSPHCQTKTSPFRYSVCAFDKATLPHLLKLYWKKDDKPFYTFTALAQHLDEQGQTLIFAMNAGMYDNDFAPIGHTIIEGQEIKSLNLKDGAGNFHLMPNGVFWWDKTGFYVDSSSVMADKLNAGTRPLYATQSGPMLVINGQIHPKFDPNSTSAKLRNGVGVDCTDDKARFIISDEPVRFYDFASVFKDDFGCQNALFLDGGIASALYAPEMGRKDDLNMGVMVAVIAPN